MKRFLAVLSLALGLLTGAAAFASDHAGFQEISIEDLDKLVSDKSAVIIDVNSAQSYADGHIPGAISYAGTKSIFATVLPKDKATLLVAYCGGPLCVAWEEAAKKAQVLGYTNIRHYKGGIKVWKESGKKFEKT